MPAGRGSGAVTTAGVLQIIVGSLIAVFSLYGLIAIQGASGALPEESRGLVGAATGVVVIILLYALAQLVAGIFTLQRKGVGRILGIVLSAIGTLIFLWGLIQAFQPQVTGFDTQTGAITTGVNFASVLTSLLLLAANLVILVMLARKGEEFIR